jgi:undecaprenyl pyrophosphate phosphatase UppP
VILVYWQKIHATVAALPRQAKAQRLALNILIGFLPAVVLGLLFGKAIKAHLITPAVVATTFILGGFVIRWRTARPSRVMLAVPLERSLLERIRSRRRCLEFRDLASLHRVTPIRLLKPRRVARLRAAVRLMSG